MIIPQAEDNSQRVQNSSFSLEGQKDNHKIIQSSKDEGQQKCFKLKIFVKNNWRKIILVVALLIAITIAFGIILLRNLNGNDYNYNNESNNDFVLVLSQDPAALCLDGSPGAYYISKKGDPQKFIISFMQGGWCGDSTMQGTLEACYIRSFYKYGTTTNLTLETNFKGILSSKSQNYFRSWTRIRFMYCDGAGHQGTRKDPVFYKGRNLYFRGHNITLSHFKSLQNNNRLFSGATHIVVQGQSAGALAALMWTNYVVQNAKKAKVFTISDSGLFLDAVNVNTNQYEFKKKFQNLLNYSNSQIDLPVPQCVSTYSTAIQNCMFAQNFYINLKAPVFYVQSLYDGWSVNNIVGVPCAAINSLRTCSQSDIIQAQQYRLNTTNWLLQMVHNSSQKGGGMWAIACVNHEFNTEQKYSNSYYRIPNNSKYSIAYAISKWMQSQGSNQTQIYQDTSNWPDNRPCSGL